MPTTSDDHRPREPSMPYTFTAGLPARPGSTPDDMDQVAIRTVRGQPGVLDLRRVWRHPADGSPWPPPRRVYLVEADLSCDLTTVSSRLRRELALAGERDSQVEVHLAGSNLTAYHRLALATAALLWTR